MENLGQPFGTRRSGGVGGPGTDEYAADPGDHVLSVEIVAGQDACID
jgi:hypothetical protein